jgi:hypothetical protein
LTAEGGLWDVALIDGAGVAEPSPYHAGSIEVESACHSPNYLSLLITNDPSFDQEREDDWQPGMTAPSRYNNAFLTGMAGWMPRPSHGRVPATEIVVRFVARWPQGYASLGTSGVWLEQQGTFDAGGFMQIPFQAAGLSYTGASSFFVPGLAIEGSTGMVVGNYAPLAVEDISRWHEYTMTLGWRDASNMVLGLAVDGGAATRIDVTPFGPFEVQLWRDNSSVVPDEVNYYRVSFENFPAGWKDPFQVASVSIHEQRVR